MLLLCFYAVCFIVFVCLFVVVVVLGGSSFFSSPIMLLSPDRLYIKIGSGVSSLHVNSLIVEQRGGEGAESQNSVHRPQPSAMKGSDPKLHRVDVRLLTYQLHLPLDPTGKHIAVNLDLHLFHFLFVIYVLLREIVLHSKTNNNKKQNKKQKKQVAFPGKSQLQQSRTTQP